MVDLSLIEAGTTINIEPSNNIFQELGNNTYDYKDLLSELIDNSIAARFPDRLLKIDITVTVDGNNTPLEFRISDNAMGIPIDKLAAAITPAGIQSKDSLNEHGLGMKQAVSALGRLNYLATKTEAETNARIVREFKFGPLEVATVPVDFASGTVISVTNLRPMVIINQSTITKTICPYLGARYRRFLKKEKPEVDICVRIIRNGPKEECIYESKVTQVKPMYLHPSTRENSPVIHDFPLEGKSWSALLTFGYAPTTEAEYEELGLDPPNKFHPYRVSLSRQGLDILLHNRVILFHQLSELELVSIKHNDYNGIRGEISLLSGFSTAITKNSIIHDDNFRECIEHVKAILNGEKSGPRGKRENYLKRKSYPEEIPEALLRDRLKNWLLTNSYQKRKNVNCEYVIEGIEGYIDIFADGEAWELKVNQATALDVYQLFMYMDVAEIKKGFLVAGQFSGGAKIAAEHIGNTHKREIVLALRSDYPINHAATSAELEEYY